MPAVFDVTYQPHDTPNEWNLSIPREPIKVVIWIYAIPVRRRPRVTRICTHVTKRPIPRIGTQHPIPNRRKVGKRDVEWGVLCVKRDQTVKDGLKPVLTPGVLGASTVNVSNEEVAGVGRGLGEESHLAEERLGCLKQVVSVN